jgi:hypothetical protein
VGGIVIYLGKYGMYQLYDISFAVNGNVNSHTNAPDNSNCMQLTHFNTENSLSVPNVWHAAQLLLVGI